jgi:transcriptional regulator with XRE-family HTH domain
MEVGTLLWTLRTERGLSLGKLAMQAGVSKSALSQWETQARLPRMVELESVLEALGASESQRSLVLAQIDAPRAVRRLRDQALPLGAPPVMGDLVRAMRMRRGWTQAQTGAALGVTDSTVARWERGERSLATEHLQTLCYVLEARKEEVAALTQSKFPQFAHEAKRWEAAEARLRESLQAVIVSQSPGLEDLQYYALEAEAWRWAAQEPAARHLLVSILMYHAQFARNQERWTEIQTFTRRAVNLLPSEKHVLETRLRVAIFEAAVAVYGGHRPAPRRGLVLLERWRDVSELPEFAAWILSDIAKYAALETQWECSLRWAAEAYELAKQKAEKPIEGFLRACDYGRLLTRAGQPAQALQILPEPVDVSDTDAAKVMMALSDAHYRVGNRAEAQNWLMQAQPLIAAHDMKRERADAETLAEKLS